MTRARESLTLSTTQKAIDYYEWRAKNPSLELIARVAEALEVSAAELMGAEAPKPARRRGPMGKLEQVFERAAALPRRQAARKARGLSQVQLARLLDTTQKTIDYYERRATNGSSSAPPPPSTCPSPICSASRPPDRRRGEGRPASSARSSSALRRSRAASKRRSPSSSLSTSSSMSSHVLAARIEPDGKDQQTAHEYVDQHDGVYWVAGTRVSLDSVVLSFLEGLSPETIVTECFPVLTLEQVYGAIAYYLAHRAEVDAYLKASQAEEEPFRLRLRETDPRVRRLDELLRSAEARRP